MKIAHLADHPQFTPTLAQWLLEESRDYFGEQTWADVATAIFQPRLNRDRLPLALVAFEDERPLGTISLSDESITTHKHLSPWLAALYVVESERHRGVATQLIAAALDEARRLGFVEVFIGISRAEEFYTARGWEILERVVYHSKPLTILQYDFLK